MHEASTAAYPRSGGVLVPAILINAGCPTTSDRVGSDGRSRAATDTVTWLRDSLGRLPPEVLDASLPDPGAILRSWSLGARTRGALARLGGPGERRDEWRVRDLVGASRVGPAALVDILAAREEQERRAGVPPRPAADSAATRAAPAALAGRLDEISAVIRSRLPLRPEELGDLFVAAGLSPERPSTDDVARLFRDWEVPVPFRVVRRGGAHVLVSPTSLASAEALVTAASYFVFHWGLCTMNTVVERVRSLTATELGADAAARVLATIPRFRWLDEASGWFSFAGDGSRVLSTLRKVFAVSDRVLYRDLSLALAKRVKALSVAPRTVIEAYLSEVADCEVRGGWIRPRASFVPDPLSSTEHIIVDVLRRNGGNLDREALRRLALQAGAAPAAVRHFLRTSPLVMAGDREIRLLGLARGVAARQPLIDLSRRVRLRVGIGGLQPRFAG